MKTSSNDLEDLKIGVNNVISFTQKATKTFLVQKEKMRLTKGK